MNPAPQHQLTPLVDDGEHVDVACLPADSGYCSPKSDSNVATSRLPASAVGAVSARRRVEATDLRTTFIAE